MYGNYSRLGIFHSEGTEVTEFIGFSALQRRDWLHFQQSCIGEPVCANCTLRPATAVFHSNKALPVCGIVVEVELRVALALTNETNELTEKMIRCAMVAHSRLRSRVAGERLQSRNWRRNYPTRDFASRWKCPCRSITAAAACRAAFEWTSSSRIKSFWKSRRLPGLKTSIVLRESHMSAYPDTH